VRANRLLSILLLLQARGRMTAQELARELEVSERTIYRDVNALSLAGVPVYGEPGREGGFALLDSYRTNLTGLTKGEMRALAMLGVPGPLVDLGVSQELRSALLKLSAALPGGGLPDEERARQCFHLDSDWWRQSGQWVPHLQTVHQAIWQDQKLHVVYHLPIGVPIERLVAPYGLVAKAGVWYLVCARNDALFVHRVSELLDVRTSNETFERPADFDLAGFWRQWCADYEGLLSRYSATVRVAPGVLPEIARSLGDSLDSRMAQAGRPDAEGWVTLELSFGSFEAARDRILGFGRGVEVVEPRALRTSVLDYAQQIVALYAHTRKKPT